MVALLQLITECKIAVVYVPAIYLTDSGVGDNMFAAGRATFLYLFTERDYINQ